MPAGELMESIPARSAELESKSAQELLAWALTEFRSRVALAASFGAEDVVLIDMLMKLSPTARVFTLDTGRLSPETYTLMEAIRERYGLAIEVYFPQAEAVEAMVREHGVNLFYKSIEHRKRCCGIRKIEPLGRALQGLEAWLTGLRREQAVTRTGVQKVEVDVEHGGIIKLNPLADWTGDQVWAYIRAQDVPYNGLHDRGYPSIGCAPCTRAVGRGEDPRAGRWWWESPDTKECGLHVRSGR
ncbi:MAG: phosphoadenylyl-sulfate reductase [Deltaproteobacteria bacterium]|nr:phosphoadenylyl-sulfate reductase [Deltaproteobacteria bacterium]